MEVEAEVKPYPIIESSPAALSKCDPSQLGKGVADAMRSNAKYPIGQLLIGQSFAVPFASLEMGTLQSLRSLASQHAKRGGKKFAVLTHKGLQLIEVARIA